MAVYGPGCHTQNIIWTEAKCRELFVTLWKFKLFHASFNIKENRFLYGRI
jgi:hypothetical protein